MTLWEYQKAELKARRELFLSTLNNLGTVTAAAAQLEIERAQLYQMKKHLKIVTVVSAGKGRRGKWE